MKNRTLLLLASLALPLLSASPLSARDVVRLPVPYMAQPTGDTCLPTSLAMAMHFLGRCDLTTDTVRKLHRVCRYDRYNVPDIVKEYGLYALPSWLEHGWNRESVEAELRAGRPVILGLDCTRAGHFVLAVGYTDDGKVIIHDPYWKEGDYPFGGPYHTTNWDPLIWRNGIMLRGEPFPEPPRAISGTLVETTHPRTMVPGQVAVAEFAIRNNGRAPWPDEVYLAPVDAYTTPTRDRKSPFALLSSDAAATSAGAWISEARAAAPDRKNLPPGEIAYFRVPLKAPEVGHPTTFRENWNLVDGQGRWFSEHWQTGPGNRQIFFRMAVLPKQRGADTFPLIETAAEGRVNLPWRAKFGGPGSFEADSPTTAPPDGLRALRFLTPGRPYDMAFVGDPLAADYRAEAWIYCDYRPEEAGRGFDRVGLFLRDSGQHRILPKTELENGECLLMTYDSDNGRVRMGNFADGGLADYLPRRASVYLKESGWHKFGIRASGTSVTFELDGVPVHTEENVQAGDEEMRKLFPSGDCGVLYRTTFADEADRRGVRFAGFRAEDL